jgi:hypothetical protein
MPIACKRSLFVVALTLAMLEAADACSYTRGWPSEEELFAKATVAFVGYVTRVEEVKVERTGESSPPTVTLEATFRVEEVLKGTPPPDSKLKALVHLGCNAPVLAAVNYLFFLDRDGVVHDGNIPGSSVGALIIPKRWDGEVDQATRRRLERLRVLSKQGAK